MAAHHNTQQNSVDDQDIHSVKKLTYWRMYGVRKFPYRGRRRYTPLIYQSYSGQIIISNDVFGLTIQQFEREFRNCQKRREENQEYITNIRFPDKTSHWYMNYLELVNDRNGLLITLPCLRTNSEPSEADHLLYTDMVKILGTETDVRTRQRFFKVYDVTMNLRKLNHRKFIYSGSLSEGLDLPDSDKDIMILDNDVTVTEDETAISKSKATLQLIYDHGNPGFVMLKLLHLYESGYPGLIHIDICRSTTDGLFVSTSLLLNKVLSNITTFKVVAHGPCVSNKDLTFDFSFCLRTKKWPSQARDWINRHRPGKWPPTSLINKIVRGKCLVVPIGPRNDQEKGILWRLSFSLAEKTLVHCMNYTQLLCYSLLKLTNNVIINREKDVKDYLCSYFLKTALFYVSEETSIEFFRPSNLFYCFCLCIDKLISWIRACHCPNYFIPENNMLKGKINHSNNQPLLYILYTIRNMSADILKRKIFENESVSTSLQTKSETKLDFFLFRICTADIFRNADVGYHSLSVIQTLQKSEQSTLIKSVLEYCKLRIHRDIAQLLTESQNKNLITCHKHLLEGIKSDAVSGWILLASFYYKLGQYKVTLQITEHVLSRCTPDMIVLHLDGYSSDKLTRYERNVGSSILTFNEKIKLATISNACYVNGSNLVPCELQVEVKDFHFSVPAVVISHCLRFLCYHHLSDFCNREQALRDLYLTISEKYFVSKDYLSVSLVILGVCSEMTGDKETAYQCYDEAMRCEYSICKTAELRKSLLFNDLNVNK